MKKVIALLMATLMLVGMLAACGDETQAPSAQAPATQAPAAQDPTQAPAAQEEPTQAPAVQEPTQAPTVQEPEVEATEAPTENNAPAGQLLDAPEVVFDADSANELYVYFIAYDEAGESTAMELAIKNLPDDSYVLYATDGPLKVNETVYEVTDAGIAKYTKDVFAESFQLDTTLSQTELKSQRDQLFMGLAIFMMMGFEGVQYEKTDDLTVSLTGESLTYNIWENGQATGKIAIDKATGLMVNMMELDGTPIYTVMDLAVSDVEIPQYK